MPSSVHSGSHSSSNGSRKARSTYRMIAPTSQVDESLFGAPHRDTQMRGGRARTAEERLDIERQADERTTRRRSGGKKETVQLITKDLVRELIVPEEDPSGQTAILSYGEFQRIRNAARVLTKEERQRAADEARQKLEEVQDGVSNRRQFMKIKDMDRKRNEKLNDIEEEEKIKSEHLKAKALEQLQEQEDDIKKLNEMILGAKIHAIRDAQIVEKGQIQKEMKVEEKRLDQMMELDRLNSIKIDEEIERKRKDERLIGAMKIMEQIQENEQERLLDLERKDQENRLMQKYLDKLCEEEAEKIEKRHHEQKKLREDLNKCNAEILRRREVNKEQDKLIDEKIREFQRDKAERELAFEKEQEKIRIEKEREVARLRALQERANDEQAERDALRAKRATEEAEREWRRKEAREAKRKAEVEAMLQEARSQQRAHKEHYLAVQAQRERADFERVLRAQQELVEKEQREEIEKKKISSKHSEELRQQIRAKERERINERNDFFAEAEKLDEEARQRRLKLEEVKRKKLNELRDAGIHEKYIAQIERKVNQPQHAF